MSELDTEKLIEGMRRLVMMGTLDALLLLIKGKTRSDLNTGLSVEEAIKFREVYKDLIREAVREELAAQQPAKGEVSE